MCTEEGKMLRNVLDRQQHRGGGLAEGLENPSTPRRGGSNVTYPRIRLMDNLKLEQYPLYTLPPSETPSSVQSTIRGKVTTARPDRRYPPHVQQKQSCQFDRFIPSRHHQNIAESNYLLTRVPPRAENFNQINVFDQVSRLQHRWRKNLMKSALEKANLLPGTGQQRVLNIRKSVNRDNYREAENISPDGFWKVKARNKPLIGSSDDNARISTTRNNFSRGLLDWGATNLIAVMSGTSILLFDGKLKIPSAVEAHLLTDVDFTASKLKWNHAGNKIAVCTDVSEVIIFDVESLKIVWCRNCHCASDGETGCEIPCVEWSFDDAVVVTACSGGRITSYKASSGAIIDSIFGHNDAIITMAISPNDRYLVTAGMDNLVHVYTWPSLTPHLAIGYFEPVQALAWHPWEPHMLCVGGGFDDGSLTLWDVSRQSSLGFRKVPFHGVVKSMAWNKLSGELVVQWNYEYSQDTFRVVVPVLANLDQIVDNVVPPRRVLDIVWNPDGTQMAMRARKSVRFWNFFGNESSKWYDETKNRGSSKYERQMSAGRIGSFADYTIR